MAVLGDEATERTRPLELVTALGWTVLVVAVLAWFGGWLLGWRELMIVAAGGLLLLAIAVLFTFGRAVLAVSLTIDPVRVVVGEPAVATVDAQNTSGGRMLPLLLEARVGAGMARIQVPSLGRNESFDEVFIVPTDRRSVIPLGPVRSVRGDPLGLLKREVAWTEEQLLYVHPRTVQLPGITSGWIRDLEGRTTNDISSSDLAFHMLREYVPGDDRRHIHWRTTARTGKYMVRQFLDTRRSHMVLVLVTDGREYADPDEFELAVSVAGSLARSALAADQPVSCVTAEGAIPSHSVGRLLDGLAAVELIDHGGATSAVQAAVRLVPTASVAIVISGSALPLERLRSASGLLGAHIKTALFQVQRGAESKLHRAGRSTVATVGDLDELQRVVGVVVGR